MKRASVAALTLALGGGVAPAQAQGLGESTVSATITQRFEADSNYRLEDTSPGTSFYSDTRLGLDYVRETSTQRLLLGGNVGVRLLWEAEEPFDVTYADPAVARARYEQDWADGSFGGYLRYLYRRLDGAYLPFDPAFEGGLGPTATPDDLTTFDGDENRVDAGFSLALRTDAPSSYFLNVDATNVSYSNLDEDVDEIDEAVPRNSVFGEAIWRLRINPILSGALVASYDYYEADNATDIQINTAALDAGVIYEADQNLTLTAGVGYEDRQQRETIGGERLTTEDDQGVALRGSVLYALDDLTFDANARVTNAAPSTRWTGDFLFDYDLPRGRIYARGYRDYGGDAGGDETLFYGAGIGLERDINTVSRWGVDLFGQNQIDQDDSDVADLDRIEGTARYVYDFAEDISATFGYRLRLRTEDGSAQSNAIFVAFGKTFTRRP